jgi:RHH-type proline utilization regulon transcriptional repressor/proline dehydrogenase/delta 1-pyrroline-5-carboxylate dehydrogenase
MQTPERSHIRATLLQDEAVALTRLEQVANLSAQEREHISAVAAKLVGDVRGSGKPGVMESFLAEFGLSSSEGIALMCLAEALLRVPDAKTIDELIQDKIVSHDWSAHLGESASTLVNASTWALMLTGKVLDDDKDEGIVAGLQTAVRRLGEPVVRNAAKRAMREMGTQFVLGEDIAQAMSRGDKQVAKGFTYSYDMLGEAARTAADAERYALAYSHAIASIATRATHDDIRANPGISVKLSALHPRYEFAQRASVLEKLTGSVLSLAQEAKTARIGFNIDAEEADRLDLSLDVIEAVLSDESLAGWDGFGVVVQAYGQRCLPVIDWVYALAERLNRRVMIRLVKGAYWDVEIKRAQTLGLDGFPVFTRKSHTDVSYIACARRLLALSDRIYPQFATHNAHTVAAILDMAGKDNQAFEFQRLHGMGETLHDVVMNKYGTRCRIYAPVGAHHDLLAYLVRRLLENGANSSFVNQIVDEDIPAEVIARDPFKEADGTRNPVVIHPQDLFAPRRNSQGWDLTDPLSIAGIESGRSTFANASWEAGVASAAAHAIHDPAAPEIRVGSFYQSTLEQLPEMIDTACASSWSTTPVAERAVILRRAADLYEAQAREFFALATREAGKSLLDAVSEVREAVDFLRYYADQALVADEGTVARGVIVCISPWNFPLAIFTGQIAAALVTGNTVVAKPAEQTPLIAARATELLHEAGIPLDALQLAFGAGQVGAGLVSDSRIAGVCFTGSTEVSQLIDRQLATSAPDAMLIAETGGLNVMIVDSSALPEQAVRDIVQSAFQSAGQRCSALRLLYVQGDIEESLLEMLYGAMDALSVGNPWDLSTDVGPVIDADAQADMVSYLAEAQQQGRLVKQVPVPDKGYFVSPSVVRVNSIDDLPREIFGPVLHVASFDNDGLPELIRSINARGYGLTFGLHTRIDRRVQYVVDHAHVGNLYVNRNQIGAVVGSQPFGGLGLSGTGPKAGGPHYLPRFRARKNSSGEQLSMPPGTVDADAIERAFERLSTTGVNQDPAVLKPLLKGVATTALDAVQALGTHTVDLPGPTGETNRLSMRPRGRVLCLGPSQEAALAQVVQALCLGNTVVAILEGRDSDETLKVLAAEGLPVAVLTGRLDVSALDLVEVDAVARLGGGVELRRQLAQRDGARTPVISELIDPVAYAHEHALCMDTTAAGGNATLLANAG